MAFVQYSYDRDFLLDLDSICLLISLLFSLLSSIFLPRITFAVDLVHVVESLRKHSFTLVVGQAWE